MRALVAGIMEPAEVEAEKELLYLLTVAATGRKVPGSFRCGLETDVCFSIFTLDDFKTRSFLFPFLSAR